MSLQLHRPDERGVLKPEPARRPTIATSSDRPAGARRSWRAPAQDRQSRDAPDVAARRGQVLAGLAVATFALLVLGYGVGFWNFPR